MTVLTTPTIDTTIMLRRAEGQNALLSNRTFHQRKPKSLMGNAIARSSLTLNNTTIASGVNRKSTQPRAKTFHMKREIFTARL